MIIQKDLTNDKSKIRISKFKTLQEFGGGRKGSSDHCPLFYELEREDGIEGTLPSIVASVIREEPKRKEITDPIMREHIAQLLRSKIQDLTEEQKKSVKTTKPSKAFLENSEYDSVKGEEEICLAEFGDDNDESGLRPLRLSNASHQL